LDWWDGWFGLDGMGWDGACDGNVVDGLELDRGEEEE
jgi:hypothetical protein